VMFFALSLLIFPSEYPALTPNFLLLRYYIVLCYLYPGWFINAFCNGTDWPPIISLPVFRKAVSMHSGDGLLFWLGDQTSGPAFSKKKAEIYF
jgi:hypothetical protein